MEREFTAVLDATLPWVNMDGQRLLNLASNNYLGLSSDDRLRHASEEAVHRYGCGAVASRLMIGNHPLYAEAEEALKAWKGANSALIFNSGYTANLGIISSLMGHHDVIFSDRLNHASIVDGMVLSRAKIMRYRHGDLNHLEALLKKSPPQGHRLIVTDAVFSMDGDVADLKGLVDLKERYHAWLFVDEAHSGGIYGDHGEGYVHHLGLQNHVEIQMGTCSKAMGSLGGYVTGEDDLIRYLINKARSLIYSTALPPADLGAIIVAIDIVRNEPQRRRALFDNSAVFRSALKQAGFDTLQSQSQIVPIVVGTNELTTEFAKRLRDQGIAAVAVRPPTVPLGQARIRFSIMATHDPGDLLIAAGRVAQVGRDLGVIQ